MLSAGPVRVAVVGVGHLGRHHARVAAHLPGVSLVGVHDHHEGRAEAVAREWGTEVLASPAEAAERADAVVVATPTSSHAELAAFFLERGRDVLVEKPIAGSLSDAAAMVALARARGRILQVGHVERYNPAVEAALAAGAVPAFVEAHRLGVFAPRSLDVDVVLDLMIHDLQIVAALVGEPVVDVRAFGMPVVTPRLDVANARIEFAGGAVANVTASRVSTGRLRRLRIYAPDLTISVDMDGRSADAARVCRDGGRPRVERTPLPVADAEPLALELEDFAAAVRERRDPLVTGELGRDALALAHRVLAAAEERRAAATRA